MTTQTLDTIAQNILNQLNKAQKNLNTCIEAGSNNVYYFDGKVEGLVAAIVTLGFVVDQNNEGVWIFV